MLDVTDRHFRVFVRLLSERMKLYTEMKVSDAILHGSRDRFLGFAERERPLAIQLGGSDPVGLARCARLAERVGYDEINLNIGCPSARVKHGQFGACLMAKPALVAKCVAAMRTALRAANPIAVTVKTRIGIDQHDRYEYLADFVAEVAGGGCEHFIIHARKAWLHGLNPKQNRMLPPLRYELVYRLKQDFPHLRITINGGINTLCEALQHLQYVDGVMVGRAAWHNPWLLNSVDQVIWGNTQLDKTQRTATQLATSSIPTRAAAVDAYLPYVAEQLTNGVPLRVLVRPLLGLYHGQPGAKKWRQYLTERIGKSASGLSVITQALALVEAGGCKEGLYT